MPLTDFFRINMPYGLKRNSSNEWFVFNREYLPLGWNKTDKQQSIKSGEAYSDLPVYTKYKNVTESLLLNVAWGNEGVQRNELGEIDTVFLYNDSTNPQSKPKFWTDYFNKIKLLSKLDRTV